MFDTTREKKKCSKAKKGEQKIIIKNIFFGGEREKNFERKRETQQIRSKVNKKTETGRRTKGGGENKQNEGTFFLAGEGGKGKTRKHSTEQTKKIKGIAEKSYRILILLWCQKTKNNNKKLQNEKQTKQQNKKKQQQQKTFVLRDVRQQKLMRVGIVIAIGWQIRAH